MCAQAHVLIRQSTREKKRQTGKYERPFVPLPRSGPCLSAHLFDTSVAEQFHFHQGHAFFLTVLCLASIGKQEITSYFAVKKLAT